MIVALTVVAELGDLTRFDNPRQLAAFVGLIPSEHSSGEKRRQGGITKGGNSRARRALVEAAWAYRYTAKISPSIQKRLENLPRSVQDIAWKAQVRLCKRFRRLTYRGKHSNVAVMSPKGHLLPRTLQTPTCRQRRHCSSPNSPSLHRPRTHPRTHLAHSQHCLWRVSYS
jgi:hypothetical protein